MNSTIDDAGSQPVLLALFVGRDCKHAFTVERKVLYLSCAYVLTVNYTVLLCVVHEIVSTIAAVAMHC